MAELQLSRAREKCGLIGRRTGRGSRLTQEWQTPVRAFPPLIQRNCDDVRTEFLGWQSLLERLSGTIS